MPQSNLFEQMLAMVSALRKTQSHLLSGPFDGSCADFRSRVSFV
jgi:hypothetical protein